MHEATWISDRGCPIGKWRLLDYDRQGGRTRSSGSSWDQTLRASETYRATFGGTLASRELWFGRSGSDRYLSLLWGLVPRVSGRIPSGASCPK